MLFCLSVLYALATLTIVSGEEITSTNGSCLASCTVVDTTTGKEHCTFTAKVNLYASELGYFQFEECGDVTNPTLGLEVGKTYEFVQHDPSN